jgi:hypothetical protein
MEPAVWLHVGDMWYFLANPVEIIQTKIHPSLVCNSQQVQYSIGRTTERHHYSYSIFKCFPGHNLPWIYSLCKQIDH